MVSKGRNHVSIVHLQICLILPCNQIIKRSNQITKTNDHLDGGRRQYKLGLVLRLRSSRENGVKADRRQTFIVYLRCNKKENFCFGPSLHLVLMEISCMIGKI